MTGLVAAVVAFIVGVWLGRRDLDRRYLRAWLRMGGAGYPIANTTMPTAVELNAGTDIGHDLTVNLEDR